MARTAASSSGRSARASTAGAGTTAPTVEEANVENPPVAPTPFTISPAAQFRGILDFKNKTHVKVFENASKRLVPPEQAFDAVETQLHDFLAVLKSRAIKYGWVSGIMMIPMTPGDEASEKRNILESHGSIPIETIRKYEESYINAESRERQDMECLFNCLMESLSSEGRTRVLTERSKFIIKDELGKEHESGNLLLKVIIDRSAVDNYSGAYAIRMELGKLPELLAQLNFNITKFNERVKSLTLSLAKMGKTSDDLPFNLIQAYKTVPVPEFRAAIERLRDESDNSDNPDKYTDVHIMDRAENKFRSLKKENAWSVKEDDDQKILALEAKVRKLEKANRALSNKKGKGKVPTKTKKSPAKSKQLDINRKPKDITKPITFKGKKFWWCSAETGGKCPGALRRHKPSDCRGASYLRDKNEERKKLVAEEAVVDGGGTDIDSDGMSFN